ncbi:MAG: hypothetical protein FWF23_02230 [Alphaproteobacteria bacterium]|nr:hypothetical protein [Alphaproteobacteria bacterium]MCL2504821.1 hypothetical protein [Alphaproteobacteria bacterium]
MGYTLSGKPRKKNKDTDVHTVSQYDSRFDGRYGEDPTRSVELTKYGKRSKWPPVIRLDNE